MKSETAKCACEGGTLMRFVQPLLLSLLSETPDHGYDLLRKIGETALWRGEAPDAAGVYRVLRGMETRGLVESRLDADSIAGVGKRVFAITDAGRACMGNWLQTLRDYREGVSDVIARLEQAVPGEAAAPSCRCCNPTK